MGVTIIPYQAVAREVRAGTLFCARIAGTELVRETGWCISASTGSPERCRR
jgi:hypothetical protein